MSDHQSRQVTLREILNVLGRFQTTRHNDPTIALYAIKLLLEREGIAAPVAEGVHVVGVAHICDGMIISAPPPHRHHNVLRWLVEHGHPHGGPETQGFLLSNGEYADRPTAAKIALQRGQINKLISAPDLYSEDLF